METPLYLLGLGLLILPPLLRMFFPPKPVHLGFSQMRLLNQILEKQKFKKQNNPWWLNLIRMVLIALLIFSLTGLRWGGSQIEPDASLAIVYDDSLYGHQISDDGILWELERQQILEILGSVDSGHRVALIGRSGSLLEWGSASEATAWFLQQTPGYLKESWSTVLRNITRLYRQREDLGFQILFTGSEKSHDPGGFETLLNHLPEGIVFTPKFFEFEPRPNKALYSRVIAQGSSLILQGKVLGEKKGRLKVTPSKGDQVEIVHESRFRASLPITEWAKLELEGEDGFPLDDIYYLSNEQARPRRLLLLLRPEANQRLLDSGYYLEQGFQVVCEKLGLQLSRVGPRQWKQLKARRGDLVLLLHPPKLGEQEWTAIGESLTRGAHLLLLPGPTTPEDLLDDVKLAPARLKMGAGGPKQILWKEKWKELAPKVTGAEFKGGWDFFHLNPKASIEQRYQNGGAFHLRLPLPGGGSFQLMSSPMSIHWSTSVLEPDFPAFLENLLHSGLPPKPFPDRLGLGVKWSTEVVSIQTLGEEHSESQQLGPGVYKAETKGGETAILTRNLSPEDYQPRYLLTREKKEGRGEAMVSTNSGPRLDPYFGLGVLLFLILEALVLKHQIPQLLRSSRP